MPTSRPRPLLSHEIPAAAEVIAQAYVDDPLCAFMPPLRGTRVNTLRKFFRAYLTAALRSSDVLVVGDPIRGVAIWTSPEAGSPSISVRSLGTFLPLLATLYPAGLARARPATQLQAALRARHARARHWYLDNVAVLPSQKGGGLAFGLIRHGLAQANVAGLSTYTDTFTASNVSLYEHFGFRCVEMANEPRTGLSVWSQLRAAL